MEKYLKTIDGDPVDAVKFLKAFDQIKEEYDDGLTKADIPIIIGRLMIQAEKIVKMDGTRKKNLVIQCLYKLIERIDEGEKDTALEQILKHIVSPTIDSIAFVNKINKSKKCSKTFLSCLKK